MYASEKEARYAERLDLLKRAGEVKGWDPQVRYNLIVNGHKITSLTVDFVVEYADGRTEWVDVKGYRNPKDPAYRLFQFKKKLMWACHKIHVEEA